MVERHLNALFSEDLHGRTVRLSEWIPEAELPKGAVVYDLRLVDGGEDGLEYKTIEFMEETHA